MKLTTILFDLDGTLLPMDNDAFTKGYFKLLAKKMAPFGYEPKALIDAVWAGTAAMVKNDGRKSNKAVFWEKFCGIYGQKALQDQETFQSFYENEFQDAKALCGFQPLAAEAVHALKAQGYRVALATNPIFPAIATQSRIRWAGLLLEDFALCTTYENTAYCKPNPAYYADVAARLGVAPQECLMVGNDVQEDMIASQLGMRVFLLTDCLINRTHVPLESYPHGGFPELLDSLSKQ